MRDPLSPDRHLKPDPVSLRIGLMLAAVGALGLGALLAFLHLFD